MDSLINYHPLPVFISLPAGPARTWPPLLIDSERPPRESELSKSVESHQLVSFEGASGAGVGGHAVPGWPVGITRIGSLAIVVAVPQCGVSDTQCQIRHIGDTSARPRHLPGDCQHREIPVRTQGKPGRFRYRIFRYRPKRFPPWFTGDPASPVNPSDQR
ncbi:hypothetical protein D9M70_431280 [compost metagenome]